LADGTRTNMNRYIYLWKNWTQIRRVWCRKHKQ